MNLKDDGFTYNPDFIDYASLEGKVASWYITDAGANDDEEGVYVYYRLDNHPEYGRGFTLTAAEAKELASQLLFAANEVGKLA